MRTLAAGLVLICLALAGGVGPLKAADRPNNIVLFVADGLRAPSVDAESAPAMTALAREGTSFPNSHSLFPTVTTANASALSTGHGLGDTGNFSNTLFVGFPVPSAGGSVIPFLENDGVLRDMDAHFAGNYLNEENVLKAAREAGYGTAAIGKLGPTLIFDHTDPGNATIVIDDKTGKEDGVPLAPEVAAALAQAGLPPDTMPGAKAPNVAQQDYLVAVVTKAILPLLQKRDRPFVLVFWSRDPDGTQHNQTDNPGQLTPGINGPTSRAAIRNADNSLARLREALDKLGLAATTNVIVTADHGFSTISKQSATSAAAKDGRVSKGFVALDLARGLDLPLYDPDSKNAPVAPGKTPSRGSGLIGNDPARPDVVVAAGGGSDLIYLPGRDRALAKRVLGILAHQDYVGGLFADDALGPVPGALPLSAVGLKGAAITPTPTIVVSFRSFSTGCNRPELCAAEVADTGLAQGQGMHGSLSRADTWNFMAATGPDFRKGFVDPAPVSNADLARTVARLLALQIPSKGALAGRVIEEAIGQAPVPAFAAGLLCSAPGPAGLRTVLRFQQVGAWRYFDAAGFPGRAVGLGDTAGCDAPASPHEGADSIGSSQNR